MMCQLFISVYLREVGLHFVFLMFTNYFAIGICSGLFEGACQLRYVSYYS